MQSKENGWKTLRLEKKNVKLVESTGFIQEFCWCKSARRLHSKDDQFILAAKKLWVGLALCTMFMVTSAEEYAAANLRIDGSQWKNPRPFLLNRHSYIGWLLLSYKQLRIVRLNHGGPFLFLRFIFLHSRVWSLATLMQQQDKITARSTNSQLLAVKW